MLTNIILHLISYQTGLMQSCSILWFPQASRGPV